MEQGRIIRSLSGFYDVDNGQEIVRCRAKGSFRQKKITPLVGDEVRFVPQGAGLERRYCLGGTV